MDWRTALTTFGLVFIAELGDKTQLATMLLAAESRSLKAVFLGAAGALVISALLAVIAGDFLGRVMPLNYLRMVAGFAFIVIGIVILRGNW